MARGADGQQVVRKIAARIKGQKSGHSSAAVSGSNPFARHSSKISAIRPFTARELEDGLFHGELRLALVSLGLESWKKVTHPIASQELKRATPEVSERVLVQYSKREADRLASEYKAALSFAVEKSRPHIVCVNELAFPARDGVPTKEVLRFTRDLAEQHRCLILTGSFHDAATFCNSGTMFFPGSAKHGVPYHKQVPATWQPFEEIVSVPAPRTTAVVRAFGVETAVLICSDLVDYTTVASIVQAGERIDMLFVACYSPLLDAMKKIAQDASRALPGLIVLVNAPDSNNDSASVVYRFGERVKVDRLRHAGAAEISLYKLDLRSFHAEKLAHQAMIPADLQWLFGVRPVTLR